MNMIKQFFNFKSQNQILPQLELLYKEFANIFSYSLVNEDLLEHLSKLQAPTNQVCAKKLINVGAWQCRDCEKDSTCIICDECYEKSKEKHNGHKIKYKTKVSGCCDCGDPDAWSPNGFCSDHIGTFNNDNDIENYVNSCFKPEIIDKMRKVLINICHLINIDCLNNEKDKTIKDNLEFNSNLNSFLEFIDKICNANLGILHIVSEVFLMNFPYNTKHNCFRYENGIIKYEKNDKTHCCFCPFIKILISVWNSNINHEKMLFSFLHNFKLKREIGLIYLIIIDKIMENDAKDFLSFSVQIISDEVSTIISKNPKFLNNIFDMILDLTKEAFSKEDFFLFNQKLSKFYIDMRYLIKPCTYQELSKNVDIYKKIIDMGCILHNSNIFEISKSFQREGWKDEMIEIDLTIIKLFELFVGILNFNDISEVKEILNYLVDKIVNQKYRILNKNEYSFHIIIYRLYSIFLNSFCFSYAIKNKVDLLTSLNYIMSLIQNRNTLNEILIKGLFKFFGLILSIELNFWVYYGEKMYLYRIIYCHYNYYSIDITLFKYLFSLKDNSFYLSIDKILELCSVNNSHIDFIKYIFKSKDLSKENLKWCFEDKLEKHTKLNSKIINLFIRILRDNISMLNLFCDPSYLNFTKNKNIEIDFIFENDKEIISNLRKEILIHHLLSNKNLVTYSDLKKSIPKYLMNDEMDFMNLVNEITDKIKTQNQEIKFSVKNKYLKEFDLNYIFIPDNISSAEKYILDFKKEEVNLINTYFYQSISIQKSLELNCYFNFYFTNKNLEFEINFCKNLIKNVNFSILISPFLMTTIKYFLILIHLIKYEFKESNLIKEELYKYNVNYFDSQSFGLVSELDNSIITDNTQKKYCDILKNELSKTFNINIYGSNILNEKKDETKKNKNKEKFRDKFKKMNKDFENKNKNYFDKEAIKEEEDYSHLKDTCVYCRNKIDENDFLNNPYGILGILTNDKFIFNIIQENLKNKFQEITNSDFQLYNNEFILKKFEDYHIRLLSCNHKMHIKCYNNFLITNLNNNFQKLYGCPLCKKSGNILIPSLIENTNTICQNYYKGLSIEDINLIYQDKTKIEEILKNKFYYGEGDEYLFIDISQRLVESFCTSKIRYEILIKDLLSQSEFEDNYKGLINEFHNFFFYYSISNYKKNQIENWGNFILSLRIMLKTKKIVQTSFLINRFIELINILKKGEIGPFIINNQIDEMLSEFLFLTILLFEKGNYTFEKNIFGLFMIYISFASFVKTIYLKNNLKYNKDFFKNEISLKNFEVYISNTTNIFFGILKSTLAYLMNKINISKMISNNQYIQRDNKYENLISDFYPEITTIDTIFINYNSKLKNQDLNIFKPDYSIKDLLNIFFENVNINLENIKENSSITKSLFNLAINLEPRIISLPENIISLITKYNSIKCHNCQKFYSNSLICLICGTKLCDSPNCSKNIKSQNINSKQYHTNLCGGGNSIYLSLNNGNIKFISDSNLINSDYNIYLNKFGERISKRKITNEYTLNKEEVNKAINSFIDITYRKFDKYKIIEFGEFDINIISSDEEEDIQ